MIEGDRNLGLVLVADHARRDLPEDYGDLGLPASEFDRHIAYDIGAEAVTRRLAALTRRAGGAGRLLAAADRPQSRRGRPDADPPALRRHRRAGELPDGGRGARKAARPASTGPTTTPSRAMIASVACGVRQCAVHLLGPFLHAGDAGFRAALAGRRAVGPRRPRGAAADRHAGARIRR